MEWLKKQILEERLKIHSQMSILYEYMYMKADVRDYHAVEDSASDLRDHEAELKAYERVLEMIEAKEKTFKFQPDQA